MQSPIKVPLPSPKPTSVAHADTADEADSANGLNGNPVDASSPDINTTLVWNGFAWVPQPSSRMVLLARLTGPFPSSGSWYPSQGIGIGTGAESSSSYDEASGPPMLFPAQKLHGVVGVMGNDSISTGSFTIWVKPFATGIWGPSAYIVPIVAGELRLLANPADELELQYLDQICCVLNPAFGFSPGGMSVWGLIDPVS